MQVRDWMTKDVVTVSGATSVREAIELMKAQKIRHLPVVEGGRLIGIVTDRDLRQAVAPPALRLGVHETDYVLDKVYVHDIMTRRVVGVSPDVSFAKAAELMVRNKIGCLPVLQGETVVGIITESDILRAVAEEERGTVGHKGPSRKRDRPGPRACSLSRAGRPSRYNAGHGVVERDGDTWPSVGAIMSRGVMTILTSRPSDRSSSHVAGRRKWI